MTQPEWAMVLKMQLISIYLIITVFSSFTQMKSASSGLDVIAEEDNDEESNSAQVVPSIVATGGSDGNAEMEDESEVMSQVCVKAARWVKHLKSEKLAIAIWQPCVCTLISVFASQIAFQVYPCKSARVQVLVIFAPELFRRLALIFSHAHDALMPAIKLVGTRMVDNQSTPAHRPHILHSRVD